MLRVCVVYVCVCALAKSTQVTDLPYELSRLVCVCIQRVCVGVCVLGQKENQKIFVCWLRKNLCKKNLWQKLKVFIVFFSLYVLAFSFGYIEV